MEISSNGINFIKRHEAWRDKPYLDPKGVPTIGYGHTRGVTMKMGKISREEGERLLKEDLNRIQNFSRRNIKVPLNQNQWDAMTSFVFNTGGLRNQDKKQTQTDFLKKLNSGMGTKAFEQEFPRWIHSGGKKLDDLIRRRGEEMQIARTPVGQSISHIPEYANIDESGYTPESQAVNMQRNDPGVTAHNDAQNFTFPFVRRF